MLAHAHAYIYWVHVHIDRFHNGRGRIQANFQVAGSSIWVPGLEQLTRSVWTNGVIKLAASMLESYTWVFTAVECLLSQYHQQMQQ